MIDFANCPEIADSKLVISASHHFLQALGWAHSLLAGELCPYRELD